MDLNLEKLKESDMLQELWDKQSEFDRQVCERHGIDTEHEGSMKTLISNSLTALSVEVSELQNELSIFKFWKKNKPEGITKHAKEEFIDCLCFLISIGTKMFDSPEEMLYYYDKKMKVNVERQNNGY